jgi:hypothetical protein
MRHVTDFGFVEVQLSFLVAEHVVLEYILAAQLGQPVTHRPDLLGGVPEPVVELADDPDRLARAERPGGVAGQLLVGDVGIVLDLAERLDDVDPRSAVARCHLGAPGRGVQGLGAGGLIPLAIAVVGAIIPPRDRGRYQGLIGSVFGSASIIGPAVGGFIVDNAS